MTSQASRSLDAAYGEYLASRSSSASRTPSTSASPAVYPSASRTPSMRASDVSSSSGSSRASDVSSSCRKCVDAIEHLESTGALSGASRGSSLSPSVEAEKQQLENFIERSRSSSPGASRGSSLSASPTVMRQIDQIFASTERPSSARSISGRSPARSAPVVATRYSRSRSPPQMSRSAMVRSPSRGSGLSPSPVAMQQISQILSGSRASSPSRSSPGRAAAVQDVDRILRSASGRSSSPERSAKIVRQVINPDTGAEGQVVRRADGELRYYIDGEMVTQEVFEAELGY